MAVMDAVDEIAYAWLLAQTLPHVIGSDKENERTIAELERLDSLPCRTKEEDRLAELLTVLVLHFETRYHLGHAAPLDALKELMENRGLRQRDLLPAFGSGSVTSDVLTGKRKISKQHARKLAEFFSVPAGLFI